MGLSSSSSNSFIFFLRKSMLAIRSNELQVKCYLKRARVKQREGGKDNENVKVHAGDYLNKQWPRCRAQPAASPEQPLDDMQGDSSDSRACLSCTTGLPMR